MKRPLHNIVRLALIIIPMILTVTKVTAQVPLWGGPSPIYPGDTIQLSVQQMPGDTYNWELYKDSTVNFAVDPGDVIAAEAYFADGINTGTTINIVCLEPGPYFYKVEGVDATGCTNNLRVGRLVVNEALPTAILSSAEICIDDPGVIEIEFDGTAPFTFNMTDGTNTIVETSPTNNYTVTLDPGPRATTDYWITEIEDFYGINTDQPSDTTTLIVNPKPDTSRIYQVDR